MATNIEIKKLNRNNVYKLILSTETVSKQELSRQLGISIPTVTQNLNELMNMGLIIDSGVSQSTGGRKAQTVTSVRDAKIAIGIDITQNHLTAVVVDLQGNIVKSIRFRKAFCLEEQYCIFLRKIIEELIDNDSSKVLGVNLSIPGIVDNTMQHVLYAPLLSDYTRMYEELKQYVNYPFKLMNDANAGAYSELFNSNHYRSFLYLMLSNSVGGAVVIDSKILSGLGYRSGEFGHVTLVPNGRKCYCGKYGCVDAYCSALRLSSDLSRFFNELQKGNTACKSKWDSYVEYLSLIIHNLQIAFDCDIVLGGYVGWYLKPYLPLIQQKVNEQCNFPYQSSRILIGKYNEEASALGAALYSIQDFISKV